MLWGGVHLRDFGRIQFIHNYDSIISIENLLLAWKEFVRGKRKKKDVEEFQLHLMDNILDLHRSLSDRTYTHGKYEAFNINDPKPRNIHKALVRDRLLHHAIYRTLYPFFDRTFISDSYSCRVSKGTHKAIKRFIFYGRKVSKNNTKTCWILKCDIRKFFASIDHSVLIGIIESYIPDADILWLLDQVISSFYTQSTTTVVDCVCEKEGRGLPLGNLTSQLLVNIYMNEFDQFVKHKLKAKYYIRYADDFVIFSKDRNILLNLIPKISKFLSERLKLSLNPNKVFIKTLASGVDFLGWVHFPHHRVLRTATKRRMFKRIEEDSKEGTINSYLGMLLHGDTYEISRILSPII